MAGGLNQAVLHERLTNHPSRMRVKFRSKRFRRGNDDDDDEHPESVIRMVY